MSRETQRSDFPEFLGRGWRFGALPEQRPGLTLDPRWGRAQMSEGERDVQEALGIAYRVQTKADRLATLRERLESAGLEGRFLVQELGDRIGLFGAVRSPEELSDIRELAARFNEDFGARPRLALAGTDAFLGESTIDLDVRAVVLGDNIHVVLHDGETHGQGSRVADGYAIQTITERYMVLERSSNRIEDGASASEIAYFVFEER